jgi:protein tyrosine/serine phosphatase
MLLGVDKSAIVADFVRSTESLRGSEYATTMASRLKQTLQNTKLLADDKDVDFDLASQVFMSSRPEFLGAAFEAMEARYETADRYLAEGLGVSGPDRKKFQDRMLSAPLPPPLLDPRSRNY